MSAAFIRGLTDQFPKAKLTFDNFHLIQLLTKAVDETRREEQRTHPELKGTRYVWLKNDWNRTGYGGPAPPSGTHRYFFKVYALDTMLDLPARATKGQLESVMAGHILAHGQLLGMYARK